MKIHCKKTTFLKEIGLLKILKELKELTVPFLGINPDLTKAEIAELQKALPKCLTILNAKK